MITGLEIPFLAAFLYPSLNYIKLFPKLKPTIEKEIEHVQQEMDGIEIYTCDTKYAAPIYISLYYVNIPVGGSASKKYNLLYAKHMSKDKKKEFYNFHQIKDKTDNKLNYKATKYINTEEAFLTTFKDYNIPNDQIEVTLPLKINYYNYKNGVYIHNLGVSASNKDTLVKEICWRKRLPLSVTIPIIATTCLVSCWIYYKVENKSYSKGYYPPFHPKRIKGYFTN
jgi:hypothetical protein